MRPSKKTSPKSSCLHIQLFVRTRMFPMSLYVPNRLWGRPVASLGWSEHALLPSIKKTLQLNQQIHSNSSLRGSWSKPVISTKFLLLTLPPEGLSFYLFSPSPLKLSRVVATLRIRKETEESAQSHDTEILCAFLRYLLLATSMQSTLCRSTWGHTTVFLSLCISSKMWVLWK